jgi:hypothetical protein
MSAATCLTHSDVWDGAVPFMATTDFARQRTHSATAHNAHRLLSPRQLARIVDVVEPGGFGDPFSAGDPTFSSWVVDGRPVEPQHEVAPYEAPMPSASFTATYRRIENLARARVVVSAG